MINYDTSRGSVTVQTDPGPTQSRLTIRQAVESDTGNYTCNASNTKPASIFVFVTEGDKMAAIQRRKTSAARKILNEMLLTAMLAASLESLRARPARDSNYVNKIRVGNRNRCTTTAQLRALETRREETSSEQNSSDVESPENVLQSKSKISLLEGTIVKLSSCRKKVSNESSADDKSTSEMILPAVEY
uniref:Ig-like domain-containing protein n=1 Tax=Vespula pensylvanica TaxID=30213 RepID=A0A834PCC2_VESPE|nr:hypothetical protein H0235_003717 [Vespula pensylvanica]